MEGENEAEGEAADAGTLPSCAFSLQPSPRKRGWVDRERGRRRIRTDKKEEKEQKIVRMEMKEERKKERSSAATGVTKRKKQNGRTSAMENNLVERSVCCAQKEKLNWEIKI